MKRYFYTDPLAAAWMAKHHGMKFWNGQHEIHLLPIVDSEKSYFTLLHPDSLHLLEPRLNDLISWTTGAGEKWEQTHHALVIEEPDALSKASRRVSLWKGRIVERSDIHFMWPESEEA